MTVFRWLRAVGVGIVVAAILGEAGIRVVMAATS